jgi:sucrose phosphorylase
VSEEQDIRILLDFLYGEEQGEFAYRKIMELVDRYKAAPDFGGEDSLFSEKDVVLITYGDSLQKNGQMPLAALYDFADTYLKDILSTIHILPCFPWSSDDGFSVIDYNRIDPQLGSWDHIRALASDFKLMLDYVLNHISAQSPWMKKYLAQEEGFEDLAIEADPETDLSMVTRPRALPLLTPFRKDNGEDVHLWTTFSADQVDLNFKSLDVLLKMVEVLFLYAREGGSIVRLDAIAYLWKETHSNCIHLPQTHAVVKLLRKLFNAVRKNSIILTETNVPHPENISYFGDGHDEAQMVYNFTLPPLLLYSFLSVNFTASHDGIGVRPLEGIIDAAGLERMAQHVNANNGSVSYKRNPDGSESPYELNITYVDAMAPGAGKEHLHVPRFLASQAIQMVMPGVHAVYIHSLLGSRNWTQGVKQTRRARTINREKLDVDHILKELGDEASFRNKVFSGYSRLLKTRRAQPAFHPNAPFEIPDTPAGIFLVVRRAPGQTIYALTNVTPEVQTLALEELSIPPGCVDLLTAGAPAGKRLELAPYQVAWLEDSEI